MSVEAVQEGRSQGRERPAAFVILAAGKGTRMRSATPKVLHQVAGRSMLGHTLALAAEVGAARCVVVVGHEAGAVEAAARAHRPAPNGLDAVVQAPQLGTAHAVAQARTALEGFEGDVFVLFADTPLIRRETIERLAERRAAGAGVAVLGFEPEDPAAYGRLILDGDGALERIVEFKDADESERAVRLCNSGVMAIDGARLWRWLDQVGNDNAKGEYYLTDLIAIARAEGAAAAVAVAEEAEVLGVNDRIGLAAAEAAFQARARSEAMTAGVTLTAPETVFFAHDTVLGRDVVVEPHVVFGPGVTVADDAIIRAFSHLEGCRLAPGAVVGPYARLRPGAEIGEGARIGNFVEVKNARFDAGAKANHLSYIGDAVIGAGSNIGAGTITCNYDGYLKHRTEIGESVFIGSNTALVAPVTVGDGAIVGAGSTVTDSVESDALALARGRQTTLPGRARRLREMLAQAAADKKKRATGG